jgi:hypothetical protein
MLGLNMNKWGIVYVQMIQLRHLGLSVHFPNQQHAH